MNSASEICKLTSNGSGIASAVVCAVKFVNSFTESLHLFDIAAKPIDVDSNFLLYPAPLFLFQFNPKCNHLVCSWQSREFIEISSVLLRSE